MQDAEVSNIKENTGDSLLGVDDLIMEIGRLNVEKLNYNKEKMLLIKKIKVAEEAYLGTKAMQENLATKEKKVAESNALLAENNRRLDETLVKERKLNDERILELNKLKEDKVNLERSLSSKTEKLNYVTTKLAEESNQSSILKKELVVKEKEVKDMKAILQEKSEEIERLSTKPKRTIKKKN
jgi:chromosome segregation ATPase